MKPLYIFDLDGTLADAQHRLHFIQREHKLWGQFHTPCVRDTPMPALEVARTLIQRGNEIWIFTGRDDAVRDQTVSWFEANGFCPDRLRMREHGDRTQDHELKRDWYLDLKSTDQARLVAVFEDRSRVVRMWRELGVPCFQVAEGNF